MAVETTGNKKKQQAAQNDNNDRAAINNEDPQQHRQRFSLLDSIRDTLDRQGRKQIIHRIVVCGEFQSDKLTTGNRQEIGTYYQKFFKQFQDESDVVTGMLFIFSTVLIHVVEGSDKVINSFVRDLTGPNHQFFTKVRVLSTNDDIPQRSFPFWFSRVVELRSVDSAVDLDNKPALIQAVSEACINLLKLGEYVSGLQKSDLKQALDDLYQNNKHLIPRQDLLLSFTRCDGIMSIQDWRHLYDSHNLYTSETELTWPAMAMSVVVE